MSGRGMDRHLLAWRMLASENSLPTPSICATDAYQALQHFQVSTSQVISFLIVTSSCEFDYSGPNQTFHSNVLRPVSSRLLRNLLQPSGEKIS